MDEGGEMRDEIGFYSYLIPHLSYLYALFLIHWLEEF
jgi:hypothetical protein